MIRVTWKKYLATCIKLAWMLKCEDVWGPPRSGFIVAGILSYYGCHLVQAADGNVTIVDDVADSGHTLKRFREKGFKTSALFVRYNCNPKPDVFVEEIDTDDYILMPYENYEDTVKRLSHGSNFKNGST